MEVCGRLNPLSGRDIPLFPLFKPRRPNQPDGTVGCQDIFLAP